MMNWTEVQDLKRQVLRPWLRGEFWEPRRLALNAPDRRQLSEHFEDGRRWLAQLDAVDDLRIQCRDINLRVIGLQRLPAPVRLDSAEDAFAGHSRHTALTCAFGCGGVDEATPNSGCPQGTVGPGKPAGCSVSRATADWGLVSGWSRSMWGAGECVVSDKPFIECALLLKAVCGER
ncbi:hypothetical protein FFI16_001810 [Pseudomonas sp. KBS0710]|nr:hypothetical protein FFI16_001810 [Pseudomonas sp. KBS0710]